MEAHGRLDAGGALATPSSQLREEESRYEGASDDALLTAVRDGDVGAFSVLYDRHLDEALAQARRLGGGHDPHDIAHEAFAKILRVVRDGCGPREGFVAYLLRTVHNEAMDRHRRTHEVAVEDVEVYDQEGFTSPDAADGMGERDLMATAMESLPGQWRQILWATEVEGESPRSLAPQLGRSATAVAQLTRRARVGLRVAWLQAHVDFASAPVACEGLVGDLGAYEQGALSPARARKVEAHLEGCAHCAEALEDLRLLSARMRSLLLPVVLASPELLRRVLPGTSPGGAVPPAHAAIEPSDTEPSPAAPGTLRVLATSMTSHGGALAVLGAACVLAIGGVALLERGSTKTSVLGPQPAAAASEQLAAADGPGAASGTDPQLGVQTPGLPLPGVGPAAPATAGDPSQRAGTGAPAPVDTAGRGGISAPGSADGTSAAAPADPSGGVVDESTTGPFEVVVGEGTWSDGTLVGATPADETAEDGASADVIPADGAGTADGAETSDGAATAGGADATDGSAAGGAAADAPASDGTSSDAPAPGGSTQPPPLPSTPPSTPGGTTPTEPETPRDSTTPAPAPGPGGGKGGKGEPDLPPLLQHPGLPANGGPVLPTDPVVPIDPVDPPETGDPKSDGTPKDEGDAKGSSGTEDSGGTEDPGGTEDSGGTTEMGIADPEQVDQAEGSMTSDPAAGHGEDPAEDSGTGQAPGKDEDPADVVITSDGTASDVISSDVISSDGGEE